MSSDEAAMERNYLAWSNLAYEAESHLMANGQVIPTETRIVLSNIRDLAIAMRDRARGELVSAERSAIEDAVQVAAQDAVPLRSGIIVPLEIPEPRRFRVAALSSLAAMAAIGLFVAVAPHGDLGSVGRDGPLTASVSATVLSLDDIRDLQLRLKLAGFDPGSIDGKLGPATRKALLDWQAKSGLAAETVPTGSMLALLRKQTDLAMREAAAQRVGDAPGRAVPPEAEASPVVSSSCDAVVPADMIPMTRLFFCELEKAGRATLTPPKDVLVPKVVTPFGQRPPIVMSN